MPWKPQDIMSIREEFVVLASRADANRRELCRRFGISPQTGYTWLERHAALGREGLADQSRRPLASPARTQLRLEQAVVELRGEHPAWGGRKISRRLKDLGQAVLAPSTVNSILNRHGLITQAAREASAPWTRFERDSPNALWQGDFKGYFNLAQQRCSPLTLLDDHSRFNLALEACSEITTVTVQEKMRRVFARYGLPLQMNFDNGTPWGSPKQPGQLTELGVWLVRLTRRPTARMSAFIERSKRRCSMEAALTALQPFRRSLIAGERSTTISDHTRRYRWLHRSRATNPVRAQCRRNWRP
jgi:transposase